MNEIEEAVRRLENAAWQLPGSMGDFISALHGVVKLEARAVIAEGQGGGLPLQKPETTEGLVSLGSVFARAEAAEAQIAAVREAAKPFLEAVELADFEARPGVLVATEDLRALRAALAASPDNAKQEGETEFERDKRRGKARSYRLGEFVSEPDAQGRAFKVGDRVRVIAKGSDYFGRTGTVANARRFGHEPIHVNLDGFGFSLGFDPDELEPPAPSLTGDLVKGLREAFTKHIRLIPADDPEFWRVKPESMEAFLSAAVALLTRAEKEQP